MSRLFDILQGRKDRQEQRFFFNDKIKNKFGRCGIIVDGEYKLGDYCIYRCWLYEVKWDDGKYETIYDIADELYEKIFNTVSTKV